MDSHGFSWISLYFHRCSLIFSLKRGSLWAGFWQPAGKGVGRVGGQQGPVIYHQTLCSHVAVLLSYDTFELPQALMSQNFFECNAERFPSVAGYLERGGQQRVLRKRFGNEFGLFSGRAPVG